ncbi:MAG: hypothetical protein J5896_01500 [Alphaproteobacteria bacterium]|nr:hypothetical protein [Alphaproteobacteria bacterium]
MKKILLTALFLVSIANAKAETIIVIDDNGIVKQQMTTSSSATIIQPTVVTNAPVQTVSVVRAVPQVNNTYYYDSYSTGSAIVAGVTTAVVGALLFDGFKIHHSKKHYAPAPVTTHHKKHNPPARITHNSGHH